MYNYISVAILLNILLQVFFLFFLLPGFHSPVYIMFLLLNNIGLFWVQFFILPVYKDNRKRKAVRSYRWFLLFYGLLFFSMAFYYINSTFFHDDVTQWSVQSYSYGPYNSHELGFKDGWNSGERLQHLGENKKIGVVGFSFRLNEDSARTMTLPIIKDTAFNIEYMSTKDIVLFCTFEDFNDRELSYPLVCFASRDASSLSIDISKIRFYNPISSHNPGIKHLKCRYNANLSYIDLLIARFFHYIGADNVIMYYYF